MTSRDAAELTNAPPYAPTPTDQDSVGVGVSAFGGPGRLSPVLRGGR
ncbi:hypothetical protein [Streptomyces cyanogenus]|uniref:Uncharacterized protein n=1 Tax=Streptomyces cyanogenus TaxID=80860 RepID=A0ABX7THQ9_STRCY|nr:hypothetical protein [Streptomyces cyanogenus]QTD96017.1 hypothetical protein S1361_01600 [Streptomyces cyanogenus]